MMTMKPRLRGLFCLILFLCLGVTTSLQKKVSARIYNGSSNVRSGRRHRGRRAMVLNMLESDNGKESDAKLNQVKGVERKKGDGEDVELAQVEETTSSKKKSSKSSEDPPLDSEDIRFTRAPTHGPTGPPSYGKGKGKGKGSGSEPSSKSSKKRSKKEKKSSNKSSKKLKSKKGSSKSAKETTPSPVDAPVFPPSVDPGTRPPIPIEPPPTRAPNGPPSPTTPPIDNDRPTIRGLTPYGLDYTVTENRIPFRSEYLEVVELTRMYLAGFFDEAFEDIDATVLNEFLTIFTGSSFQFGQPIWIEYGSSAVFDASSTVVPTVEMLDITLATAFRGENLNGYIGMLQSLPPGNVFSTTIFVNQTEAGQMRTAATQNRQTATLAAGTAAGAAGVMVLAFGLLYYRRKLDSGGVLTTDKKVSSSMTVAGETYTGETYAGGWSVDQESESHPFRSSHDRSDSTIHDIQDDEDDSDETGDENSDDEHGSEHRPIQTMGMRWDDTMHSVSLS